MKEHPIEALMEIAMNNIQDMVDVNTIIGAPIDINDNISIIPISGLGYLNTNDASPITRHKSGQTSMRVIVAKFLLT